MYKCEKRHVKEIMRLKWGKKFWIYPFYQDPHKSFVGICHSFYVILLTNQPTNKWTQAKKLASLAEKKMPVTALPSPC